MFKRSIFLTSFLLSACAKLEVPENTGIADNDGDGYAVSDGDCDDNDPEKNPSDADGDGQSSCEGDCDDNSASTYSGSAEKDSAEACMKDEDGDGYGEAAPPASVTAGTDCDDLDVALSSVGLDGDCDGVLTGDDCDDSDVDMPNNDADCDGTLTTDDCDDSDAESTTVEVDEDCDGALTADDCDDADASSTVVAEDSDCDGVLTDDDCDDSDVDTPNNNADCDDALAADDCDDSDAESTIVAEDEDCDGLLTADDCDDGDSTMPADDADCDGVLTADDCDDGDSSKPNDDADCDGALTSDDCDDDDESVGAISAEGVCDGDFEVAELWVMSYSAFEDGEIISTATYTDVDSGEEVDFVPEFHFIFVDAAFDGSLSDICYVKYEMLDGGVEEADFSGYGDWSGYDDMSFRIRTDIAEVNYEGACGDAAAALGVSSVDAYFDLFDWSYGWGPMTDSWHDEMEGLGVDLSDTDDTIGTTYLEYEGDLYLWGYFQVYGFDEGTHIDVESGPLSGVSDSAEPLDGYYESAAVYIFTFE